MPAWIWKRWRLLSLALLAVMAGAWWWSRSAGDADDSAALIGEAARVAGNRRRELLDRCPPARRAWEWHALAALADGLPPSRRLTPMKEAGHALLSADGRVVAVLFGPGTNFASLLAFDLADGQLLFRMPEPGEGPFWPERLALSADGRSVAVSAGDRYAPRRKPWRIVLAGGRQMGMVGDEWVPITRIGNEWLEDRQHVDRRGFLLALDLRLSLPFKEDNALDQKGPVALGAANRLFFGQGGSLRHPPGWDKVALGQGITSLDLSPDESRLAIGGAGGAVLVVDASDGTERLRIAGSGKAVVRVRFGPDGSSLAVADAEGVTLRDAAGASLARIAGSLPAFAPDGRLLVAEGKGVSAFDARTGKKLCGLGEWADHIADMACRDDGTLVVLGVVGADLAVRELRLGEANEGGMGTDPEERDPLSLAHLLRQRSETRVRRGDLAGAKRDLEEAQALDPRDR